MAEEMEESTLPPLLTNVAPLRGVVWDNEDGTFNNTSRKRGRPTQKFPQLFSNSSDPAVFSSDDDPSVDNYTQGRRKKRYIGSWYQQHLASTDSTFCEPLQPRTKRAFVRQMDSGVWMGSDGAESDIPEEVPVKPSPSRILAKPQLPAEEHAQQRVDACLEEGNENVDLSSLGLDELSDMIVGRLSQISIIPLVTKGVPFEQRDPALKLYLSCNNLARLNTSLFDLENITLLSLRGNQLTELPPGIRQLKNLETLNVSQNCLRWLPIELLDLIRDPKSSKLTSLQIHPNPFIQPDIQRVDTPSEEEEEAEDEIEEQEEQAYASQEALELLLDKAPLIQDHLKDDGLSYSAMFWCRSPIHYADVYGNSHSSFVLDDLSNGSRVPIVHKNEESTSSFTPPAYAITSVPTLVDVALRACYKSPHLGQLSSFIPDSLPHLRKLLENANVQRETTEIHCCKCQKLIITPKTQWLDWYAPVKFRAPEEKTITDLEDAVDDVADLQLLSEAEDEMVVPFISRGCSWKCISSELNKGDLFGL